MSDGDPNGVFRRGYMPMLYRRRFSPAATPIIAASFLRHRTPQVGAESTALYGQIGRRRFSPSTRRRNRPVLFTSV